MKPLLLGIDVGTGACKVSIIDETGHLVYTGSREYPTFKAQPTWSEQNPEDWYQAAKDVIRSAFTRGGVDPKLISGIGLSASTHNAVLLDSNMRVLRPCIMWTDQRSTEEVAWLNRNFGDEIFRVTYQIPNPTWTLPQLLWIQKHEESIFRRTCYVMFTKDFLRYRLVGTWESDFIDAQGSMLLDAKNRIWSKRMCEIGSIPVSILPPLVEPTTIVGSITEAASLETGLPPGTPVVAGASDTATECYGVGAIHSGQCVIKLATAGTISVFAPEAHPHPKALTYAHVVPGLWYTCMGTNSAAASLRWYRDVFCAEETREAEKTGVSEYELIDNKAEKINLGSDGLIFHPYLMGERSPYWDSDLRASFVGMSSSHHKGHFARAIMEGVAFSLKDCFGVLEKMGLPIEEIRIIGGGAKSPLWRKIIADILERPLIRAAHDDASFGAAMLAGVGIGIFRGFRDSVEKCVKIDCQVLSGKENAERYRTLFAIYQKIHDDLEQTYKLLRNTTRQKTLSV